VLLRVKVSLPSRHAIETDQNGGIKEISTRTEVGDLVRMISMKALSIRQPWLHAILTEGKDIENRTWQTKHRGWIALHASGKPMKDVEFPGRLKTPELKELDYSAICGIARVLDVVTKSRSKWFFRYDDGTVNYGWVLGEVIPLKTPIECRGSLGLWTVEAGIVRKIKKQLPGIDFDE